MSHTNDNPVLVNVSGAGGMFFDAHGPPSSFVQPYSSASFVATQRYRWSCSCYQGGALQWVGENIPITRSVFMDTDGKWKYKIQKSGAESGVVLPGQ